MRAFGDPGHPPILFLHGIRLAGAIWEPHARALANDYYCLTPDLPGHGRLCDLPFGAQSCDAFLRYLAQEVIERPALLVGYSLGGYAAMRFACANPDRVAGLLLTGCTTDIVGGRAVLYEVLVGAAAQFSDAFVQRALACFFRLTMPPALADLITPFPYNRQTLAGSRSIALNVRYSERLRAFEKPVMIVNGEFDIFRADEALFARSARARVTVFPRSDHLAPLRDAAHFSALTRRFAENVFG